MKKSEKNTYNEMLPYLIEHDFVVAFKDGKGVIIRNRSGPLDELTTEDAVNILFIVLNQQSGIKLFDEGFKGELFKTISNFVIDSGEANVVRIERNKLRLTNRGDN